MAIKFLKPTTPGRRGKVALDYKSLSKKKPEKTLIKGKKSISSRDGSGRISVRRRGGGVKRKYREIDFKREKIDMEGTVKSIEYDPNRSAFIALVVYLDGEKRYILASENMKVGSKVITGEKAKSKEGNCLPLMKISLGSFVHNIEIRKGCGGQMVRAAGASAKVLGRDGDYVSLSLPSGEVRLFRGECFATVGVVSNKDRSNTKLGKAGVSRYMGRRPKVRGVVMNPVDHPMGGGEGRTSGGRNPCSPTGLPSKGYKTRKPRKYSNRLIVRKRTEQK